jgi:hypothetical protein
LAVLTRKLCENSMEWLALAKQIHRYKGNLQTSKYNRLSCSKK